MTHLIAIDPGTYSTGYAVFNEKKELIDANIFVPRPTRLSWCARCEQLHRMLINLFTGYKPDSIAIEYPAFFQLNATAASGALVQLSVFAGIVYGAASRHTPCVQLVPVHEWKGQLSKVIVIERIKKHIDKSCLDKIQPKKDAWDAIGIGLHVLGIKL